LDPIENDFLLYAVRLYSSRSLIEVNKISFSICSKKHFLYAVWSICILFTT